MPHASPARSAPQFSVSKEFSPALRWRPPAEDDGTDPQPERPDKADLLEAARARGRRDELRDQYTVLCEKGVALLEKGEAAGAGGGWCSRTFGPDGDTTC
jgi:hypothetical protein